MRLLRFTSCTIRAVQPLEKAQQMPMSVFCAFFNDATSIPESRSSWPRHVCANVSDSASLIARKVLFYERHANMEYRKDSERDPLSCSIHLRTLAACVAVKRRPVKRGSFSNPWQIRVHLWAVPGASAHARCRGLHFGSQNVSGCIFCV